MIPKISSILIDFCTNEGFLAGRNPCGITCASILIALCSIGIKDNSLLIKQFHYTFKLSEDTLTRRCNEIRQGLLRVGFSILPWKDSLTVNNIVGFLDDIFRMWEFQSKAKNTQITKLEPDMLDVKKLLLSKGTRVLNEDQLKEARTRRYTTTIENICKKKKIDDDVIISKMVTPPSFQKLEHKQNLIFMSIEKVKRMMYESLGEEQFRKLKLDYNHCPNCVECQCDKCFLLLGTPMTRKDLQVQKLLLSGVSENVILGLNSEKLLTDHIQLKQHVVESITDIQRLNDDEFSEKDMSDAEASQMLNTKEEIEVIKKLGLYEKLEAESKRRSQKRETKPIITSRIVNPTETKETLDNYEDAFDLLDDQNDENYEDDNYDDEVPTETQDLQNEDYNDYYYEDDNYDDEVPTETQDLQNEDEE